MVVSTTCSLLWHRKSPSDVKRQSPCVSPVVGLGHGEGIILVGPRPRGRSSDWTTAEV